MCGISENVKAVGVGDIYLKNRFGELKLHNAYHVPNAKALLVSMGTLYDVGWDLVLGQHPALRHYNSDGYLAVYKKHRIWTIDAEII